MGVCFGKQQNKLLQIPFCNLIQHICLSAFLARHAELTNLCKARVWDFNFYHKSAAIQQTCFCGVLSEASTQYPCPLLVVAEEWRYSRHTNTTAWD
jgi:hypothetical protein